MAESRRIQDKDARAAEAVIQNPLMREEVRRANEQAQRADLSRNVSQYMFWGATTILGAIILGMAGIGGGAALALTSPFVVIGGLTSVATFVGSLFFSNHATKIEKYNEVLSSDIDSQNQAHRMVQAFAKAQTQGKVQADESSPMTSTGPSWADRVGAPQRQQGSWQERVVADAQREEVQNIAAVRG
jgi:hypothetical protein